MAIQKLSEFIKNLIIYDYILFGSLLALFLLFIILGIIFRHRLGVALFFIFLAFSLLLGGATFGYKAMHDYLFKNETVLLSQKKLSFTQAAVVYGTLKNVSKKDFKSCEVSATVYRVSGNIWKDTVRRLKPITKMSIVEENIAIDEERDIKIIIDPFTYGGDYNVTLGADCR
ncbi:MAG: DUF2393 domain-containing protein [Sulfurimonas sp.]|nr:DUF2393 domain-containing protein [Sulfurimonas sp.]